MSVRKREWTTRSGVKREAWIVDYFDAKGVRRLKTFKRKKDADAWADKTGVDVREGTHVADSDSVTVREAGELWIKSAVAAGLEPTTVEQYKQHLRLHIGADKIADMKLPQLTAPVVRAFEDRLRECGRSSTMVRYVIRSLGSLLADAQERGLIVRNVVRELRRKRRERPERGAGRLKVGVDIPSPDEVKAFLRASKGRWRPFFMTAVLTGLRASELRGLRWADIDLKAVELHVRQRADRMRGIGAPKTEAGERTVPLTPALAQELREWKLQCPKKGKLGLVFPNGVGKPEFHVNIILRGLKPTMVAAGVTIPVLDDEGKQITDENGKPVAEAKYTGLHSLRHFYASWCINRKQDGGLELPAKVVQERMGHSSIIVTMDTYGHLFPRGDDRAELEAAEKLLLG